MSLEEYFVGIHKIRHQTESPSIIFNWSELHKKGEKNLKGIESRAIYKLLLRSQLWMIREKK